MKVRSVVDVQIDSSEARHDLAELSGPQALAAIRRSLSRSIRSTKREVRKAILEDYNLRPMRVERSIRARSRGDSAGITIAGRASSLTDFRGTRQTKKGVLVSVVTGGGFDVLRHTFLARMSSGHRGAFERKRSGESRVGRLPIVEKFGPAPQQALDEKDLERLALHGRTRFEIELARDVAFRMGRA